MGLMRSLIGALFLRGGAESLGRTVGDVAQVFRPNATRRMELGHDAFAAAHASHGAEFAHARPGWFDTLVNGMNRLPRPLLALGTLGLFVYAMADPPGFTLRMRGLAEVPEPLWWLLGAVVAFYFGAREAHHLREHRPVAQRAPAHGTPAAPPAAPPAALRDDLPAPPGPVTAASPGMADDSPNPALSDWRAGAPPSRGDPLADPLGRER